MEIWRQDGFKFIIYDNDHTPAHVHVRKAGGKVKIDLGSESRPPKPESSPKMDARDVKKAWKICCEQQEYFLDCWREKHGE